jgi:Family of unknown function (DUF6958)
METKIQLRHPAGKKAVRMDEGKYQCIKRAFLNCLVTHGASSHTDILKAILRDFKTRKQKFNGSVEWHMEWIKLDLEAHKIIKRIAGKNGTKFRLTK